MKKIIVAFSVFCVLAVGTCFASSDIQVTFGLNAHSFPAENEMNFSVNAHQFFGETQTFGIAEGFIGESHGAHLFLGPAFGFNLIETLRLQISTGLKWGISDYNGGGKENPGCFGDSKNLLWGNDIQCKMTANRLFSFLIGIQLSTGVVIINKPADETVSKNAWYFDITPYVGLSINFRDKVE